MSLDNCTCIQSTPISQASTLEVTSPLDQFEVRDLVSLDVLNYLHISLTNIGLYLSIATLTVLTLSLLANYSNIISNK